MDIATFFTSVPSWLLLGVIVIIGMLFTELGSWLGRRKFANGIKEPAAPVGTAVSAILGLLAFMLGFTFSLTASRFSVRKSLVIAQANAIGTSYLRSSILPEKQKTEVRKLYREYTDQLVNMQNMEEPEEALPRMDEIHILLWKQTASLAQENMDSELRLLFIASVNEVIDLAAERNTVGLVFRIPNALWSALLLLTAMSMFAFGYQTGINGSRRIFRAPLLPIAFGLVIVLIADMDSTNFRRFKVSQKPLENLQKMIQRDIP